MNNEVTQKLVEPWLQKWPKKDLQFVSKCPVCESSERKLLHPDLVDNVFRTAAGKWTLWECANCNSAYLDPRPTLESIGQAYKNYYTHAATGKREESSKLNRFRFLQRALANGYTNSRYGTQYQPESRFGIMFACMLPSLRKTLDECFRWLPKPQRGQRLLDIGCGNGGFLLKARDAGWQVVGVDFDPEAVSTARKSGLDVRCGSIEMLGSEVESFDAITLSHVIEHFHDPEKAMTSAYNLLKPGGTIYLETPNIQSYGYSLFQADWRGLEPPRHLTLFSVQGLHLLLQKCGYINLKHIRRRSVARDLFLKSLKLQLGISPYSPNPGKLPMGLLLRSSYPFHTESRLEYITLLAYKANK